MSSARSRLQRFLGRQASAGIATSLDLRAGAHRHYASRARKSSLSACRSNMTGPSYPACEAQIGPALGLRTKEATPCAGLFGGALRTV